jgi:hypothetical protein
MKKALLLASAVLLAFAGDASAQILYQDFTSGTPPHGAVYLGGTYPNPDKLSTAGTTPPTPPAKWSANGNAYTYGNSASLSGNNFNTGGTASLPFVPVAGIIYSLSANISVTNGSGSGYAALGFTSSSASPSTPLFPYLGPEPYLQLDSYNGGVQTNAAGVMSTPFPASSTAGDEYTIVLNTQATDWTVAFYQGLTQLGTTYTYTTNPVINDIAIGADAYDTGTYSNLTLIPEPSTWAMMLGGLALLGFCVRRKLA